MKKILIAEIGNNHFGSLSKAKELIQAAHESGADLIKGQAYTRGAISGSMPKEFYEQSRLSEANYFELMKYAKSIGATMFYSVFLNDDADRGLDDLIMHQLFHKCAAFQTRELTDEQRAFYDHENCFVSIPEMSILPFFAYANILHVSGYLTENPDLKRIDFLTQLYGRQAGYSDHTLGIEVCIEAVKKHGVKIIEKHFTLTKNEEWNGHVFRDTIHGATPKEFKKLSKTMEEIK